MRKRCLLALLVLLFAAAVPSHAQRPTYAVGDVVEVKYGTTWKRGRVIEVTQDYGGVYKVQEDGDNLYMAQWAGPDRLRRVGEVARPLASAPALVNSAWQQVSVTTAGRTVRSDGGSVALTFRERGNRWDLATSTTYGTGIQLLGRGTFRLAGQRLVMTQDDGELYGDFTLSWDVAEQLLLLKSRDGSVMRLRHLR